MTHIAQLPKPIFNLGDRVMMMKHADWKNDAAGIITGAGRPRKIYDGSIQFEYWIKFDVPQRDYTDERAGIDLSYDRSNVLERFLRRLDDDKEP